MGSGLRLGTLAHQLPAGASVVGRFAGSCGENSYRSGGSKVTQRLLGQKGLGLTEAYTIYMVLLLNFTEIET